MVSASYFKKKVLALRSVTFDAGSADAHGIHVLTLLMLPFILGDALNAPGRRNAPKLALSCHHGKQG